MNQTKLSDVLLKKLFSTEEKVVLQAIDEIKTNGNSSYIPSLIELLMLQQNEEIIDQIVELLSEVKHPDAVEEFVKAIINPRYHGLLETIIGCCWQNGLDFSKHLTVFSNFLIEGEYMVAFEAYTVIQNTEEKISRLDAGLIEAKLNAALPLLVDERKVLINDILKHIPTITSD